MNRKKEMLICLLTGLASISIFCIVVRIWNMDLSFPFSYAGDVSGLLINIQAVLREESWWNFTGFGAPFHTNMWRQMMDAYIPNAIIYFIAKVTQSVGYAVNIYYIMSYGLSSMCAYYMLRKSAVNPIFAVVGSILYAMIPGHFFRNESHIYIGSCFFLPLAIVAAVNLFEGKMCVEQYRTKERLSAKEVIRSNSKEQNLGLLFFVLVSLSTTYYGIFSLMLFTFCAVYCSVEKRQLRHLFYYIQYVIAEIACVIIIYLPQIMANLFDPCMEKVKIITRSRGDVEVYAGKFIQFILPVRSHRIPFLSKLTLRYDNSYPAIGDRSSSLGFIMSLGFVLGILFCFFHKEKISKKLEVYGKIELFLFFVSTVGGLGAIVGMINYNIRCYGRFSFLIGAVAIIISMKIFQEIYFRFLKWMPNKYIRAILPFLCAFLILIIGVLDQTTEAMAYTKEFGTSIKTNFENDAEFVSSIESFEGDDANVLVFPVMNAQQSVLARTKDGINTNYNEQMLLMHSQTSNWSIPSKAGEQGERWLNWLQNFDEKIQVQIAAVVDFSGIAIYYGGYEPEELSIILSELNELLGEPVVMHKNGTWAYYSISSVKDVLLSYYTDVDLKNLKNEYLNQNYNQYLYEHSNLATTSKYSRDDRIVLTKNTWQYGPYHKFSAGEYMVETYGANLNRAVIDCSVAEISIEERNENYVKYFVVFEQDMESVEFRTFNPTDEEVMVDKIKITKIDG